MQNMTRINFIAALVLFWGQLDASTLAESYAYFKKLGQIRKGETPLQLSQRKELNLSWSSLRDDDLQYIVPLHGLESIVMINNGLRIGPGMRYFAQMPNLKNLHISGLDAGNEILPHIAAIKTLETLSLYRTKVNEGGFAIIGGMQNLKHFRYSEKVGEAGIRELSRIQGLQELEIDQPIFKEAGYREIGKMKHLEVLALHSSKIVVDEYIEAIGPLPKLRSLHLQSTKIEGHFLKNMQFPLLEEFDANFTDFDNTGLEYLSKYSRIREINIGETDISDRGLKFFAGNITIESMTLSRGSISKSGLEVFRSHPRINFMILRGTDVKDDVFELFLTMPNLSSIDLRDTDTSDRAFRKYEADRCLKYGGKYCK